MVTVAALCLGRLERGVSEHWVVSPRREQLTLPIAGLLVAQPANGQLGGDGVAPSSRWDMCTAMSHVSLSRGGQPV